MNPLAFPRFVWRDACSKSRRRQCSKYCLGWTPDTGGVSADGTLGWTEGHFTRTGPDVSATGHYVTVWVKENGVWKVRADLGNTDPKQP